MPGGGAYHLNHDAAREVTACRSGHLVNYVVCASISRLLACPHFLSACAALIAFVHWSIPSLAFLLGMLTTLSLSLSILGGFEPSIPELEKMGFIGKVSPVSIRLLINLFYPFSARFSTSPAFNPSSFRKALSWFCV